ncbi:spore germination protein [Clostridium combesii]|uniref:Spore germination protein n=1 Tax=Clostridium combesii TaxID=39481 RepID=A0A2G7HJS4_9CLOT|nr:spore germination protein [Clostridium combesii]PIH05324.1 spore germination protein [Clostridium combesii]
MNIDFYNTIKKRFKNNFDTVFREVSCKQGTLHLIFISNLCDSSFISEYIIYPLIKNKDYTYNIKNIKERMLSASSVDEITDIDEAIMNILSGNVIIIPDFFEGIISVEAKGFSKRSVSSPITESVIKGPREGFTESIMDNLSLIRRRIKNENFEVEKFTLGKESNTLVAICYLKNKAPKDLINYIKDKISKAKFEFIIESNYIEELLSQKNTLFDTISSSEKADVVCSKIFEGRVGILIDGTPFVLTAPHFFIENINMADDYYQRKSFANISRLLRWSALGISLFLPGLYLALSTHHFSLIPYVFIFKLSKARAGVPFPTIIEVLLMMFFFQLSREAGLRLPQPIGQSMSIVGALILGDATVSASLTSQSTMVVVGLTAISTFLIPKFYNSISIWSVLIAIGASIAGLPGFYMMGMVFLAHISSLQSCGYPYLYPLGSFEKYNLGDMILRDDLKNISHDILGNNKKRGNNRRFNNK